MQGFASRLTEFDLSEQSFIQKDLDALAFPLPKEKIYWIHCNANNHKTFDKVTANLQLAPEVLEFMQQKDTMPGSLETFDALTLRLQCLSSVKLHEVQPLKFSTLIIHLTPQYCLTIASDPIPALKSFNDNYHKTLQYAKTPGFILFLILDEIINDFSSMLFKFELAYDNIESRKSALEENLYHVVMLKKKQLIKVTRHAIAMRGLLMRISGRKIGVISEACRLSLVDLLEHVQLIISEANSIQDMLHGTLDQIDNTLMHELNETMRILTAFSAIFLPLTLVAGIYGMNFHWMPELQWKYGYLFALFLMIFIAFILVFIFKRKKMF